MNLFAGIIIGIAIGWLIEWVIDWLFWRQDDSDVQEKLRAAEADLEKYRAESAGAAEKMRQLEARNAELQQKLDAAEKSISDFTAQVADAGLTIDDLRAQLEGMAQKVPQAEDQLERVKGIGAVFAGRLKAAGIHTFAQLAQLTPERVEEIINPEEWQKIEADAWIEEAARFAAQQSAKTAE